MCGALNIYMYLWHHGIIYVEYLWFKIKIIKEGSKMPRKGNVPKREVLADPIYGSKVVTKLINN